MKVFLKDFVLELPTQSGSHRDCDGEDANQLIGIKVLLEKVEGNTHYDGHFLNGVDSTGALLGPPRLSLVQIGLDSILLGLKKIKLIDPGGDRAFGQGSRKMICQPGIGVAWNSEKTWWLKRWWRRWSIGPLQRPLDRR